VSTGWPAKALIPIGAQSNGGASGWWFLGVACR
jgi:hypothetical protein